jgi:hypothetical protein
MERVVRYCARREFRYERARVVKGVLYGICYNDESEAIEDIGGKLWSWCRGWLLKYRGVLERTQRSIDRNT